MKQLTTIFSLILISSICSATTYMVSPQCKEKVEAQVLTNEAKILAANNAQVASELTTTMSAYSSHQQKDKLVVRMTIQDSIDGFYVTYRALVSQEQYNRCEISMERESHWNCRYSNYEGEFEAIPGMKWVDGPRISSEDGLTDIQKQQIRTWLDTVNPQENYTLLELIQHTDDQELLTAKVTLPDGKVLDYYKAYGGDNPFGVFFFENTTEEAGVNSDSDLCIFIK